MPISKFTFSFKVYPFLSILQIESNYPTTSNENPIIIYFKTYAKKYNLNLILSLITFSHCDKLSYDFLI